MEVEKRIGVSLTENYAMWPAASVSGYYFAHPEAKYFGRKNQRRSILDYSQEEIYHCMLKKWLNLI